MARVHITHKDNWVNIQARCGLKPKNLLFPNATGGNTNMVSTFKGVDPEDVELLMALRDTVASLKGKKPEEMVILEVLEGENCQISWSEFPGQGNELLPPFGNLSPDFLKRFEGYSKTTETVPCSCIRVLVSSS